MDFELIVVIDNYDSFVHNLARYLRCLGRETLVVRNDELSIQQLLEIQPECFVISPGPCGPVEAGVSVELVRKSHKTTPILGICLGLQSIVEAFGGKTIRAYEPMHGEASQVTHFGSPIYAGVSNPFEAGRYHSLIADESTLPDSLQVTATSDDKIMSVEHKDYPTIGLQFHPESILTADGKLILNNFLSMTKSHFSSIGMNSCSTNMTPSRMMRT